MLYMPDLYFIINKAQMRTQENTNQYPVRNIYYLEFRIIPSAQPKHLLLMRK